MINNLWTLQGKHALVTGGTQGIGAAVTQLLLDLGASVTIVARTRKDLDASIKSYRKLNKQVHGICADLSNKNAAKTICDAYKKNVNNEKLDILINTIGIVFEKKTETITNEEYETNFQTNLGSVFTMCQEFFSLLKNANGATIVNMSSINALRNVPNKIIDGITRSAIINLTKNLAVEWAMHQIRVNCVAPGFTNTSRMKRYSTEELSQLVKQVPLNRMAEPEEIASAIIFLCTNASSYITGQCLVIDGGLI